MIDMLFCSSLRKEEIAALSGPNEFAEFYSRLKIIKDFHRKHPNEVIRQSEQAFARWLCQLQCEAHVAAENKCT